MSTATPDRSFSPPRGSRSMDFRAMGTTVIVIAPTAAATEAVRIVRELFADWEARLSRFVPDSELSRLNARDGKPTAVSPLLLSQIELALRAARDTGGVFDPCLLPQLVRAGYDRSFELIGSAVSPQDPPPPGGAWRHIRLDRRRGVVTLPPGAALDLGGIAKGNAVDVAVARLERAGAGPALVSAGGDLAVRGVPAGNLLDDRDRRARRNL